MTITAPTKLLRDALAKLQPITSVKANLPELGAVTVDCGFNGVELSATNLDQWMKLTVFEGDADQEVDPFSVSSRDLYDTVRLCDAEECALKVQDNYCQVIAGNSGAKLPLITNPIPAYPDGVEWGKPVLIENLPALLVKCLPFASTDPNRYILNGVYLSKQGLISTNGYSLIKIDLPIKGEANVPSVAAALIAKEEGDVRVRFAESLAEFSGDGWTLITKCIEGADGSKYFNTAPLLKKDILHRLCCNRVDAIKAAAFAALPLPTLVDVVSAEHGGDTLRFFTGQAAPNPRERTIEAKCDQNHTWAVSARKLATTLGAFEGKTIDIGFTDMQSVIIEEGPIMAVLFLCRV